MDHGHSLSLSHTCVKIPIDSFPESEESFILDTFIDIAFIVDVGLSFFTSYTDENGEEEFELKLIARNYLKTWFCGTCMCFESTFRL